MRAIWSGHITFGLISIPVGVYAAIEASERVSFRLLHRKDMVPIQYKKFCSAENVEVSNDEIVKGYEVERNKYPNEYRQALQKLLSSKRKFAVRQPARGKEEGNVVDLMEALRQSISKAGARPKGKKAASKRGAAYYSLSAVSHQPTSYQYQLSGRDESPERIVGALTLGDQPNTLRPEAES